jgi:PAS domain S-box-containing protein
MKNRLRILVVDDDRAQAELVGELIRSRDTWRDAEVAIAVSYEAALQSMASHAYDLGIFDYRLGASSGLSLLREIRRRNDETPVIVVTGHGAEEIAVEAMKSGASDYLLKGNISAETITHAIHHALTLRTKELERQRAEAALRASEERFRALVENSSDVLLLIDPEGNIIYTTPSAERQFGWRTDEILGNSLFDFIHPEDRELVGSRVARVLDRPGERVSAQARFRHADGTFRVIEGIGVNRLHEPAVGGIVINARDITEGRVLENQLRQIQKMEAIGRLAGGVAHDFNNLLTAILGYCNLLLEDLPPESNLREDLEEIRKAGERAATLTRQLLAFSRRQMLQPQPVDLNALVAEMENMLHRVMGDDIELVLSLSAELPTIKADPASIEQVLMNLALNARDAMPTGGRLTLETGLVTLDESYATRHPEAIAGSYVTVSVSDTGEGMDAATQARVFEPFFTTKEQGKGTGLGLATVYGLVKQSGGYIWVSSEPGQGTVFRVYLPPLEAAAPPAVAGGPSETCAGTETILVVEDDAAVRTLGTQVLRRLGYTVIEAPDGIEALRAIERHQGLIHLMVTDVMMPQMTGRELADRIRQGRPSMRVLFMSGHSDYAIVYRDLAVGVAFLQKPFTPETLARKIRDILDEKIASRPS